MEKIKLSKIFTVLLVVSVLSIGAFAGGKYFINHPNNEITYNEEPEAEYKDNDFKSTKDFVSDDKCIEKIAKTGSSRIKSSQLKTWQKHLEDEKDTGRVKVNLISGKRMVKVIKTEYPEGLQTKAGFYENAVLTSVFDAETGTLLNSSITGSYNKETKPKRSPVSMAKDTPKQD